jgi:hypothetical protein
VLVIRPALPFVAMVLIVVDPDASGTVRRILWTCMAYRITGQRIGSLVRRWVLESILMPFF